MNTSMPKAVRNEGWNRRTAAAAKYRPNRTRLLLVGESPPAEPGRYFYFEDPGSGEPLFGEVCTVLFEQEPGADKIPLLRELRRRGVFQVDLKPDGPRQGEALGPYVAPFILNLEALAPEQIVLIGADTHGAAYQAMRQAGLPVVDARVPSPDSGGVEFRQKLRQALVRAGLEKLIRPLPAGKGAAGTAKRSLRGGASAD